MVARIDYYTYEELKLLADSDIPLVHFEFNQPNDVKDALIALIEKGLMNEDITFTNTGYEVATLIKEYCMTTGNVRIGDIHYSPCIQLQDRYFMLSRFEENKFQIRIVSNQTLFASLLDQYPILLRQEDANDFDFKSLDNEALDFINEAGIESVTNAVEIEIYHHSLNRAHRIYQLFEQNDMLYLYDGADDSLQQIHIGVINTFITESINIEVKGAIKHV
ncbi:DUF5081 family protein [Macrococcoides canis]|uniref:DUF5081 family protein n=1 Tax=Macrococcoides canis TaxID=1855823 RepID=UPI001AEBB930|nr:DUF5081 family protein [Macrococcus canis]QTQ07266.1 DUF5081 family protein [Macrococcus canis]